MTRKEMIKQYQDELNSIVTPHLSQESIEDVDNDYQEALEIGWYKEELRDKIKFYESMTDKEFDEQTLFL